MEKRGCFKNVINEKGKITLFRTFELENTCSKTDSKQEGKMWKTVKCLWEHFLLVLYYRGVIFWAHFLLALYYRAAFFWHNSFWLSTMEVGAFLWHIFWTRFPTRADMKRDDKVLFQQQHSCCIDGKECNFSVSTLIIFVFARIATKFGGPQTNRNKGYLLTLCFHFLQNIAIQKERKSF